MNAVRRFYNKWGYTGVTDILSRFDKKMSDEGLDEIEISPAMMHEAACLGGYPGWKEVDDVAKAFGLIIDWQARMLDATVEPPTAHPMWKLVRIKDCEGRPSLCGNSITENAQKAGNNDPML